MKKIASLIIGIVLIATMVNPAFAETQPMTTIQKKSVSVKHLWIAQ